MVAPGEGVTVRVSVGDLVTLGVHVMLGVCEGVALVVTVSAGDGVTLSVAVSVGSGAGVGVLGVRAGVRLAVGMGAATCVPGRVRSRAKPRQ